MTSKDGRIAHRGAGWRALARAGVIGVALGIAGPLAAPDGGSAIGISAKAQTIAQRETLRRALEQRGYTGIEIEELGRSRAVVVVCSGDRRERLEFDRNLRARFLASLGPCFDSGFDQGGPRPTPGFTVVQRDMERMGFQRVTFEDDVDGSVGVTACRSDFEFRASYDQDGELLDLYRLGPCPQVAAQPVRPIAPVQPVRPQPQPPRQPQPRPNQGLDSGLSARQVVDRLFQEGYVRVFADGSRGDLYEISGCFGVRRFEMLVDRSAVIQARRATGFCDLEEDELEYVPPRPISDDILQSNVPLDPPLCQQVLNWLQFNRPITFRSGDARLNTESTELIRQMAAGVDRCGAVRILVEGHTDSEATGAQNQRLSEQRAENVARVLVQDGVPSWAVTSQGYGEQHPIASNRTAQGRAINRRIELNLEWGRF